MDFARKGKFKIQKYFVVTHIRLYAIYLTIITVPMYKNAFQYDAYRPRIDRSLGLGAWSGGHGGRCLVLGG